MTISTFSPGPRRKIVGFVRELPAPNAITRFRERGYECCLLDDVELEEPGLLATTDSVVISQMPNKPSLINKDLERFAKILDYDCRLYVRYLPDRTSKELVYSVLNRLELPPSGVNAADSDHFSDSWFDSDGETFAPFVHMLIADDNWVTLINLIAGNPAGAAPIPGLAVRIHYAGTNIPYLLRENELLLRRAFSDCSVVEMLPKTNGMSGVDAFEVFAHLSNNVVGSPAPFRCFVKIGPRVKVAREFEKYRATALENVPFHLGPRLRSDRCVLGKSQGLITCDYVVGAETLRDCIRDGRGVHIIGNLFNQTLISWRRAARVEERPLQQILIEHLKERQVIPEHREPLIRRYGSTKTLEELKYLVGQANHDQDVLIGTVHGDLHATNVLVRMNDAVIIDLERVAQGQPLLFDAASLEAGLFIDGFPGDQRSANEVLDSIRPHYTLAALEQDDHYCNPASRSTWFIDSIRQVRMQARQMEQKRHQYGWALATVLLKKSCNPDLLADNVEHGHPTQGKLSREDVRAMAFVLAEEIIISLSQPDGPPNL